MADQITIDISRTSLPATTWSACSEDLSTSVESGEPFALSFEIFCSRGDTYIEPDVAIWVKQDGTIFRHPLSASPDYAKTYALPAFRFLKCDSLFTHASGLITTILPKDAVETYTYAITPYGAVVVAEDWHSVRYQSGDKAIAGAIIDKALSNHKLLHSQMHLCAVIKALISFQEQDANFHHLIPEFRISR